MRALLLAIFISSVAGAPTRSSPCNKLDKESECTNRPDCVFCPGIEVGCHEGKASGPIFLASTCSNWVFAGNSAEKPPVNGHYARAWLTEELRKKWLATKDGAVKTATGSADAEEQVPGAAGASDDPDRDSTGASGPTEDGVADHSDAGTTGATGNTERDAPDGSDAGTTGATGRTKENGPAEPSATSNEGEGKRGTYHGKLAFQRLDKERKALLRRRRHLSVKLKGCLKRSKELEKTYVEALEAFEEALKLRANMRDEMQTNRKKSESFSTLAQHEKNKQKKQEDLKKSHLASLQAHLSVLSLKDANKGVALRHQLLAKAEGAIKAMALECGDEFKKLPVLFSRLDMLETEYEARKAVKEAVDATADRYHRLFAHRTEDEER